MANVLITGGTGFVGGYVIDALLEAGHNVTALARGGATAKRIEDKGIKIAPGDVMTFDSRLAAACAGKDAVIHLVGIIREKPGAGFEQVHIGGTENMLRAAKESGSIKRFLHMSALGTRPDAASRYHKSKWQAEELVRASGIPYVIFRPAVIFGPGDEFMNMLKNFYEKPFFLPVIGNGKPLMQPVYAKDVAISYALAVGLPAAEKKTVELVGPDRYTFPELLDIIGAHLGKKRVKIKIPIAFMRLAATFMEKLSSNPQITRDQLIMLQEDNISDPAEAERIFGFNHSSLKEIIPTYL